MIEIIFVLLCAAVAWCLGICAISTVQPTFYPAKHVNGAFFLGIGCVIIILIIGVFL